MPHSRIALALLALLAGCAVRTNPAHGPDPTCRATLRGSHLTTRIDFPNGYQLEGIWWVLGFGRPEVGGNSGVMVADLLLDNMTHADSTTGRRLAIPMTNPLRIRAEADSPVEALQQAATAWCNGIVEAKKRGVRFDRVQSVKPGRIA